MQFFKFKSAMAALIFVVLLMSSIILMALPVSVQAQDQTEAHGGSPMGVVYPLAPPANVTPNATLETIPYISMRPNPVGIGQTFLVNIWLQPPLHVARAFTQSFVVNIIKPDGSNVTVGPLNSFEGDSTSWFEYLADQVGTWRLQFMFLGQFFPAGNYSMPAGGFTGAGNVTLDSAYYKPATSPEIQLVVQQAQVLSWPPSPLPTDYWTRPISMENREWAVIGGNNPYTGIGGIEGWPNNTNIYRSNYKFTPFVQAPSSAHVVWRRQGAMSGIFGGAFGSSSAFLDYTGAAFTFGGAGPGATGNPSIVFEGRCYQSITKVAKTLVNGTYYDLPTTVWQCFDIRTGQIYWEQTGITNPPTAISYQANTPAVPGAVFRTGAVISLVAVNNGRLIKYDPSTGAATVNVSIAPLTTGTIYNDPYVLSIQTINATTNNYRLINWTMEGTSTTLTSRIQSNISWPFSSIGVADYEQMIAVTTQTINSNATGIGVATRLIGVNLITGNVIWNTTTETTSGTQAPFSASTAIADHGKFAIRLNDGLWHAWNIQTGTVAWTAKLTSYPWGTFGAYAVQSAYGLLFYNQYDGVHAYDWNTGNVVWTFQAPTPHQYETPYEGNYSWFSDGIVADGKLYTYTVEHSPTAPISRGFRIFCINATSGQGIWNVTGSMAPGVVADGYLTASNYYDGYLYVFGKGKSSMTITASQKTLTNGDSVLIEGTVLDQSPGSPNTPCVSKDSMTQWMEYLYMQHALPANVTGVPVTLTAINANGTVINIGTTVTNGFYGTFSYPWKPTDNGQYTIVASFAGDESYGSSTAATEIAVSQAPATSPPTTTTNTQTPAYTMVDLAIIAAVIIAIIIGLVNLILVRRR